MQLFEFAIHITIAVILGAAIGVERQWRQRQAGLRTNALVSTGAAAFVAVSLFVEGSTDPTRVLAQVVSGIGFLGGGIILREGLNVRGLNTAATLWCSAAVGSLAGMGYLLPALITTAIVLGTNVLLRPAAMLINRAPVEQATEVEITYRIEITCREEVEQHIRALLLQETASDALLLKSLQSQDVEGTKQVRVQADVVTAGRNDRLIERILSRLSMEPGLAATSWQIVGQDA